jgi:phosphoribosylamine--glycine ligase
VPARIRVGTDAAVTVMATGKAAGAVITGVEEAEAIDGASVVHARTARDDQGRLVTAGGGRILGVTGKAPSLREARERAYAGMARIGYEGMQYRSDIARASSELETLT